MAQRTLDGDDGVRIQMHVRRGLLVDRSPNARREEVGILEGRHPSDENPEINLPCRRQLLRLQHPHLALPLPLPHNHLHHRLPKIIVFSVSASGLRQAMHRMPDYRLLHLVLAPRPPRLDRELMSSENEMQVTSQACPYLALLLAQTREKKNY